MAPSSERSVRELLETWQLSDPVEIAATDKGRLFRVRRPDGTWAVLKCLSPAGQQHEALAFQALEAFSGQGSVILYEATDTALLIEHCDGPQLLDTPADAAALPVIFDVLARLHSGPTGATTRLETLQHRSQALERAMALASTATRPLLTRAQSIARTLLASTPETRLLHGDLHHGNILHSPRRRTWLAIDPQPVTGERAYDVANIFRNPITHPQLVLAPGRADQLLAQAAQHLELDPQRLIGWAYVHASISLAWSLEDGEDPNFCRAAAQTIAQTAGFQNAGF